MMELYPGMRFPDSGERKNELQDKPSPASEPPPDKAWYQKFAEETSFHGVAYWLGASTSPMARGLYFIFWLGMLGLAGFFVWRNLETYLLFETRISMSKDRKDALVFPAVTICPLSMVEKSKVGGSLLMLKSMSDLRPDGDAFSCYDPTLKDMTPNALQLEAFWFHHGLNQGIVEIAMKFDDMFLNCSYEMESFPCRDLFLGHYTAMGKCFTFNHGLNPKNTSWNMIWNLSKKRKRNMSVHGSGPYNRLSLRLNVNTDETCETLPTTDGLGFRMLFGDQKILPFMPDKAILLEPGKRIQVAVEAMKTDRTRTENLGRCESKKVLYLFNETAYTRDNCIMQCLTEEIYRECDCLFSFYPADLKTADVLLRKHVKPNNRSWTEGCFLRQIPCQNRFSIPFAKGKGSQHCHKQCPVECERMEYSPEVSSSIFPPKAMEAQVMSETRHGTLGKLQENVLEVDVYFRSLDVLTIQEDWAMTPTELFSNIGGNFGLFLGASIFSFIELLHLLLGLCCKGGHKE